MSKKYVPNQWKRLKRFFKIDDENFESFIKGIDVQEDPFDYYKQSPQEFLDLVLSISGNVERLEIQDAILLIRDC